MPAEKCEFCGKFGASKSLEFVDSYQYRNDGCQTFYLCPRCRNELREKWQPVLKKRMESRLTKRAPDFGDARRKWEDTPGQFEPGDEVLFKPAQSG